MKWGLLIWVLICLGVELLLQGGIRQQLFIASYRLTSNPGCALNLFGFFMFPGTFLHESSHIAIALLLGSRISRTSLRPRYAEGEGIELGSVIAKDVGNFRNSIISVAPTIVGSGLILLVGWLVFNFPGVTAAIESGMWDHALQCLTSPFGTVWGWIGAYVIVIVSVNMLPSSLDLQSAAGLIILPVVLFVVLAILYLTQSTALGTVIEVTNSILGWLGFVLTFTIFLSVPILIILKSLTSDWQADRRE